VKLAVLMYSSNANNNTASGAAQLLMSNLTSFLHNMYHMSQ